MAAWRYSLSLFSRAQILDGVSHSAYFQLSCPKTNLYHFEPTEYGVHNIQLRTRLDSMRFGHCTRIQGAQGAVVVVFQSFGAQPII